MDLFGDIDDISSESNEDQQASVPRQPVTPSRAGTFGVPQNQQVERRISEIRHYEDEFEDEKVLYEEDKTRLRLKVENTIRWRIRQDQEGSKIKESNARIVRWSDGSMSLHLGKEVFDIYKTPLQDNQNQLFIREDTGLRGQAVFKSRLTFRPHCTDSATYKKMALSFGNRSSKTQVRLLPMAGRDPEWPHPDLIKMQKKELRVSTPQKVRLQRKNQRQKKQQRSGPSSTIQKPKHDVEEVGRDEEGKTPSVVATQSCYQGAAHKNQAIVSCSDCRHEGREEQTRGLLKAKRLRSDRGDKPSRRGRRGKTEA